jgi:hypothetical protein
MDTIIGIGSAGCNIAEQFKKYPQYDVYKIDVGLEGENCFAVTERYSPEDYEKYTPDRSSFLQHIDGDVLFIVAGGGYISGMSLATMKQLKNCNINVLYLRPNDEDLSSIGHLQDKLVRGVLQEYARSGIFQTLYMISNEELEELVGDIPILEHNNKLNEFLVSLIHWINIFSNSDPVLDNYSEPRHTARIATYGVLAIKEGVEKMLYPLENITDKCYYYAINESTLKTDGKLLRTIRERTSQNSIRASYQVHSTKHSESFCYFVSYTNNIQPLDN